MNYYVEVPNEVKDDINSLRDKVLIKDIWKKITALGSYPTKGKHLFKNFYELKSRKYRVYYSVHHGTVIIEKIEYPGRVHVNGIGDKDSQKKDIGLLR